MNTIETFEENRHAPRELETEGKSLEQIRDILFGAQKRDYEQHLATIEDRLERLSDDLRRDLRLRVETLETYLRQELAVVRDQVKSAENGRSEARRELDEQLESLAKGWDGKLQALEARAGHAQVELREQMLEQANRLSDELEKRSRTVSEELERRLAERRTNQLDRSELSALLVELAMNLNKEKASGDHHEEDV